MAAHTIISKSAPEIHKHVPGTLRKQPTNSGRNSVISLNITVFDDRLSKWRGGGGGGGGGGSRVNAALPLDPLVSEEFALGSFQA